MATSFQAAAYPDMAPYVVWTGGGDFAPGYAIKFGADSWLNESGAARPYAFNATPNGLRRYEIRTGDKGYVDGASANVERMEFAGPAKIVPGKKTTFSASSFMVEPGQTIGRSLVQNPGAWCFISQIHMMDPQNIPASVNPKDTTSLGGDPLAMAIIQDSAGVECLALIGDTSTGKPTTYRPYIIFAKVPLVRGVPMTGFSIDFVNSRGVGNGLAQMSFNGAVQGSSYTGPTGHAYEAGRGNDYWKEGIYASPSTDKVRDTGLAIQVLNGSYSY